MRRADAVGEGRGGGVTIIPVGKMERARRVMLLQMIPHTVLGHPSAQLCLMLGRQGWADAIHYWTLPTRAKRALGYQHPRFNPDRRLRLHDLFIVPLCSTVEAFGLYRLADWIFYRGPHAAAIECGACSYAFDAADSARKAARRETASEMAIESLKQAGYIRVRRVVRGKPMPGLGWRSPADRAPTEEERSWIRRTDHVYLTKAKIEEADRIIVIDDPLA
jgi:hypothetical protein